MKLKLITSLFVLLVIPASAVTINLYTGSYNNSTSVAVPDGTLFALVADTNSSGTFGGASGLAVNGTLTSTQANSVFTAMQSITLNSLIGGDSIFYLGTVNGTANAAIPGLIDRVINFTLTPATQGLNYALYLFPGGTLSGSTGTIGSQVAGMSSTLVLDGGNDAMTVPGSNAANVNQGALTPANGGTVAASRFTAVNLNAVPEPSAILLGAIGALGLLRRRRN